jgi:putative oxidoreductase
MNRTLWMDLSILLARLALGLYFAIAGWRKIAGGVSKFVDGPFASTSPDFIPAALLRPYGYVLPFLELLAGVLLVLGLFGRVAAGLMVLMLLSILIALITQAGNLSANVNSGTPFHANYVFLTLALLLMLIGPGRFSLDALLPWRRRAGAAR